MWKSIGTWILDLLYPPKCAFCQKLINRGQMGMCPDCSDSIPKLSKSEGVQRKKNAGICYSPLRFDGVVRTSIHRYKFSGCSGYGAVYGKLVGQYIREHCDTLPEVVTWVPLSKKSLRERGYDQAYLLAKAVAQELNLPIEATLVKVRHTEQQSSLEREERSANVLGAYEVIAGLDATEKCYLLIDDVVTSGSTLAECVFQLRMAGAKPLICATLASAI